MVIFKSATKLNDKHKAIDCLLIKATKVKYSLLYVHEELFYCKHIEHFCSLNRCWASTNVKYISHKLLLYCLITLINNAAKIPLYL
jgi:hypothetical protein